MNADKNPISPSGEDTRPPVSMTTLPVGLIVVMLGLVYWGALSFDQHGGWFDARVYTPYARPPDDWQPPIGPADPAVLGKAIYNKPTCVACHQPNGKGSPGQFPSLHGTDWVLEKEPGRIIRAVLHGLQGPITIDGQTFNYSATMTPWKNDLTDEQIAAVLTYVRQNKEWGNNAPAVTPERVKEVRDKTNDRGLSDYYTPEELMKISPAD